MTLTNNYNRLIEHVNVTPDMLVRLHEALDSGKYPRTATCAGTPHWPPALP